MDKIFIGGDIYLGDKDIEHLAVNSNTRHLFGDLLPKISESQMSIANLESPVILDGIPLKKLGPSLKADPKALRVLKEAGFDLLTLANNHILDYGKEGLERTLIECQLNELNVIGAGCSHSEVRKTFDFTHNRKLVRVLNFAENEFSTYGLQSFGANPIDLINNVYDLNEAKQIADFVIVIVHGGREHYPLPSPNFKKLLRFFVDQGADMVVAHHTHCVSGYERYKNCPIFYGLGNLLFKNLHPGKFENWNIGIGIQIYLEDNKFEFEIIPFEQCLRDSNSIKLLNGNDLEEFSSYLESLNDIIKDDIKLQLNWEKYLKSQRKRYLNNLLISNKLLRKLSNRNLIPDRWLYQEEHKLICMNLIHCETHKEIIMKLLHESIYS